MSSLAVSSIVSKETAAILRNNLAFSKRVNRDWEDEYGNKQRGYPTGNTINIRKPSRYTYRQGRVAAPQTTTEPTIPLTLNQGGADIYFTSNELATGLQGMQKKIMAAAVTIMTEIDRVGCELMRTATFNAIGTPGTPPATQALAVAALTGMQQRITEMGAPVKGPGRSLVMSPGLNSALVQGYSGLFNSQSRISKMNDDGLFLDGYGCYADVDQCVAQHTNGTQVNTGTAVAAGLSGSSIACAALAGTITKGTKVSFPGVFAVNPQTRVSTGTLAQFVITADLSGGAVALPISPAMVTSGQFQNVSNATTAANFTIFGAASATYSCSGMFHKDAFTLAMVDLPALGGGIETTNFNEDGIAIRVSRGADIGNDLAVTRLDVLFGFAAVYPELSCIYAI